MRALRWTIVMGLLGAWAASATAQEEGEAPRRPVIGELAPDLLYRENDKDKGEPLLGKQRDHIVVLLFFRTDDSASADAVATLNKLHKDLGKRGVTIYGLSPEKKEKSDSFIKGKQIEFTTFWGGATNRYYDVSAFPKVYLIDTKGILVDRFHPGDNLEERVRAQMRKTPPVGADPDALKNHLSAAKQALESKNYGRAYTLAKDVDTLAEKDSDLNKNATKLLEQIQEAAKKGLDDAREAIKAKDYDKACRILAEISVYLEGTPIAGEAGNEIGRLLGDRELKPKMRKALDNAKGQLLNDQAAEHEAGKRYLEAIKVYRETIDKYADTEAAAAAEKAIERISGDPKTKDAIAKFRVEEEADRWLDLGDRFAKIKMYNKAREYYELVREKHAEASAAAKVKDRLKNLPEEQPEEQPEEPASTEPAAEKGGEKG